MVSGETLDSGDGGGKDGVVFETYGGRGYLVYDGWSDVDRPVFVPGTRGPGTGTPLRRGTSTIRERVSGRRNSVCRS